MKALLIPAVLIGGVVLAHSVLADDPPKFKEHRCGGGVSLVITGDDRFDPLVQRLLVKRQLSTHPVIDEPRFLVIPTEGSEALTESQIRYLEALLDREE